MFSVCSEIRKEISYWVRYIDFSFQSTALRSPSKVLYASGSIGSTSLNDGWTRRQFRHYYLTQNNRVNQRPQERLALSMQVVLFIPGHREMKRGGVLLVPKHGQCCRFVLCLYSHMDTVLYWYFFISHRVFRFGISSFSGMRPILLCMVLLTLDCARLSRI